MSFPENFIVDERRLTTSFPPVTVSHTNSYAVHDCQARKFVLVFILVRGSKDLYRRRNVFRHVYCTSLFVAFKITQSEPYWQTTNNWLLTIMWLWRWLLQRLLKHHPPTTLQYIIYFHHFRFIVKWWWWWWCYTLFFRPRHSFIALWWKTVSWFWSMRL